MGELGVYSGVYVPGDDHELFEPLPTLPEQGFSEYAGASAEIGARVGYYPSRFFGMEVEGGAIPTQTIGGDRATLWNARGSLVGQLGKWSMVPFVLVGAGMLGVSSSRDAVGDDVDPSLHFGGGLKVNMTRRAQLRVDLRDVVSHKQGIDNTFQNHNFEALAGVSLTLGRRSSETSGPRDTDGDGFFDPEDSCVHVPGIAPDGCPVLDTDQDGILDSKDACVTVPGLAPSGCPDSDGDGFLDREDACVHEPGIGPDGCPVRDTDQDGLLDPQDDCVTEPETANGFEDDDGCPDQLPDQLERFSGTIEGIYFDSGKATIRPRSRAVLYGAASVLSQFPSVRFQISGHTDDRGGHDYNVDLSRRRAESVRQYLIEHGIDASRLETEGYGPDRPIASNEGKRGRAKNRRIEFRVID